MAVISLIQIHLPWLFKNTHKKKREEECVTRQHVVSAESLHGLDAVSILRLHSKVLQSPIAAKVTRTIQKSQAS
jgi:hypothetical protein